MILPSKELLSEVLNIEVSRILTEGSTKIKSNTVVYDGESMDDYGAINIYELAHKCKEWAYARDFILASYRTNIEIWICRDPFRGDAYEGGETEPEAIFKLCEWILEKCK